MYEHSDAGGRLVRKVEDPAQTGKELVRHVNFEVQRGMPWDPSGNREAEKA